MKRIRNDQIRSVVGQYLKRRHFADNVDGSASKESVGTQTGHQMALQESVGVEGHAPNAIAFSSISGDVTASDQQYTRLKAFILEAVEPCRSQLQPLLYPVFVHVYMELLGNGQKTPAQKYFARHIGGFMDDPDQVEVLEGLQHLTSRDDLLAHEATVQLRENKYGVLMTEEAVHYLLRYLKSDDNVLMLQIFNNHIDLQVNTMSNMEEVDDKDEVDGHVTPLSPPLTPEVKAMPAEVSLGALLECIKRVQDGAPCTPSICFYSFLNAYHGLCSARISPHQTMLAGGFEDSAIRIWSLTPKPMTAQPVAVDVTHVHLAGDLVENIQEQQRLHSEAISPSEMMTMRGHSGAIYSLAFMPDRRHLVSASEDTTVRLWDLQTFTTRASYSGHNYPVWDIDSSVDGYFATASHDRTAKLWSTDRTYPLRSFVGHVQDVDCVRFHPNSSYLATGSSDKTVRLWNIQDGRPVRLFQGHRATVFALAFSPDGKYLASAGEDRRVKVWDLGAGALLKDLRGHTDTIFALSFNTDGTMLSSGGLDCMLRVWDMRKTVGSTIESQVSPELLAAFSTKTTTVHQVHFSKGNLLYAAGACI